MVLKDGYSEWDLIGDRPDPRINECDVIGCKEYGLNPYGFSITWKVRLCNYHLHCVLSQGLRDLETLHRKKSTQEQVEIKHHPPMKLIPLELI